ncbi:DUF115 domain-containing protein [Ectothiorhodospiraceae bacterium BW-2]|nr:DUF115 domain-containing protein [Ectothiorhodospiraceae bacterium BW-2]
MASILNEGYVQNKFGELYLRSVNNLSFDKKDSKTIYDELYKDFFQERTFYFVYGTDSGLLVDYLFAHGIPQDSVYLFIEPPIVLERLVEKLSSYNRDDDQVIVTSENSYLNFVNSESKYKYYLSCNRVKHIKSLALIDGQSLYVSMYESCLQTINELTFVINITVNSTRHTEMILVNACHNLHPISRLKDNFVGATAIILAGGPSLSSILDWVKANRERVIVFAVSRIAKILQDNAIFPDFFVSVDPYDVSYNVSFNMLYFARDSIFLHTQYADYRLLSGWGGKHYFIGPGFSDHEQLRAPGNLDSTGTTVTNTTINAAIYLGCRTIILAGADFAFSPDGFTHAKSGNIEDGMNSLLRDADRVVMANSGEMVQTERAYLLSAKHVERVALHNKKNIKFYNISKHAVKLRSVKFSSIEKIKIHTPKSSLEKLANIKRDNWSKFELEMLTILIGYMEDKLMLMESVKQLFTEHEPTDLSCEEIKEKLSDLSKYDFSTAQLFKFPNISEVEINTALDDKEKREKLFNTYRLGYETLESCYRQSIDRCRMLLSEKKQQPVSELISQWSSLSIGAWRAFAWKLEHGIVITKLDEKDQMLYQALIAQKALYDDDIMQKNSSLYRVNDITSTDTQQRNINALMERARRYMQEGQREGIRLMVSIMEKWDILHDVAHMLRALLFESEKKYLEANGELFKVESLIPKEDIPLRIFNNYIAAGKTQEALAFMSKIYNQDKQYAQFYAKALKISGDVVGAIDVYNEYLRQYSEDVSAYYELGLIYKELGLAEGVEWIINQLMLLDQDNKWIANLR